MGGLISGVEGLIFLMFHLWEVLVMLRRIRMVLLVVVLCLVCGLGVAQDTGVVRCAWEAPVTGSPVVFYEAEVWAGGGLIAEQSVLELWADFPADMFAPGVEYSARVRGVDAFDRTGVWSLWVFYEDGGAPGGCGGVTFGRI